MFDSIITYQFKPISNYLQNIHIISIRERINKGGKSVLTAHRTDFYIIQIITEGSSSHFIDFKEVQVNKGDILFLSPHHIHNFKEDNKYNGILVAFPKEFYYQSSLDTNFLNNSYAFNNLDHVGKVTLDEKEMKEVLEAIERIKEELKNPYDAFQQYILHNSLSYLLLFSERVFIKKIGSSIFSNFLSNDYMYVLKFKRMISFKFKDCFKVKDYAKELLISERKLQKSVKNVLGKSPKELIDEQLILESKRLLIHESMSIKEINYYLGFNEPTNFGIFFKKHTGISPSKFKKI